MTLSHRIQKDNARREYQQAFRDRVQPDGGPMPGSEWLPPGARVSPVAHWFEDDDGLIEMSDGTMRELTDKDRQSREKWRWEAWWNHAEGNA